MSGFGLSHRTRTFLLWTARLALVAYLVQLSAFDHWHSHPGLENVSGVSGSEAHVEHCHGAGDCSTGGGAAIAVNAQPVTLPSPNTALTGIETSESPAPSAAAISPPSEPPRAA